MKQIKFSPKLRVFPASQQMIVDTLNTFLRENGVMHDRSGVYVNPDLTIHVSCANSHYTKAYALLLLLFTEKNPYAYILFNNGLPEINIKTDGDVLNSIHYANLLAYIEQHLTVEIL